MTRQHVLAALAEHDARGAEEFLDLYGFEPGVGTLTHEGRTYDARAVLGVAHKFATGRLARQDEFHGDLQATGLLSKRGFEVTEPASARRAVAAPSATRAPRAPRAPRASAAKTTTRTPSREERPPAICPTCFTVLPATGVCDACG
ncbi:hypothetical protein [Actinotalea fermentans]|uniref:hypothetical protein n=1 Tax=Actinotalea fermentans TaxID=43671 RepID=UPI0021C0D56B|nr:hypothetical protein [Actinotalea fermentans]